MNPSVWVLLLSASAGVLLLPKRWAALPLIIGGCCVTRGRGIDLGAFTLTALHLLILSGALRVVVRREWRSLDTNSLDALILCWGAWMVASVAFHDNPAVDVVYRLRLAFEGIGLYFLFRVFYQSAEDIFQVSVVLAIALTAFAIPLLAEKLTSHNFFSILGGVSESATVRNGIVRAQGPFASPILAGTVGAVSLPLMAALWCRSRIAAAVATSACLAIVFASSSSGPILSAAAGVIGLLMWPLRFHMRWVRWSLVAGYVALDAVMKAPAYYLIARIDLTGSSSSYHRAKLIESSIAHLSEWWLIGTDYTLDWMPTGLEIDPNNTDITNHYIGMAVAGGLVLMLLFIAMLAKGFKSVGLALKAKPAREQEFAIWAAGAALFAHTLTAVSVSYFDQSIVFLYLTLAAAQAADSRAGSVQVRLREAVVIPIQPNPRAKRSPPFNLRRRPFSARAGSR